MNVAKLRKRQANEEYARRFPRRSKQARAEMRQRRTEQREKAWLAAMGIERDDSRPLIWMPKRKAKAKAKR